ncbi:MAG TPA: TonB-dependent receptor [Steroidobacteraceae bacterium]|jgi:iron complex outermembrane receptor protein|nr:TonB-dependent receptor [Steroidobacteraceae bacterium]
MNSKISYAVAAILSSASLAARADDAAAPAAPGPTDALTEITVTAQRRSENMQNVPISMQAFTAQTLQELKVTTFDDYIKYLPNVTSASNGPGQNEIFMRGLSAGSQPSQGSGSTGLWPNVAIYLDNQSGQLPNRNLDIYAADLERIEVLEGPQGTLFGAGAEAGVIRYITNQPKLDKFEGNATAGYGTTAHGDPNSNLTAVINIPLITGTMAVRGVVYSDRRGGYIDNVPATFTRKDTDLGIHYANYPAVNGACPDGQPNNGYCVPPGSPSINNNNLVGSAINPVTYQGGRVELLYKFNDDWDALITQSYQDMNSQGVFYQQPNASNGAPLQPLQVTLFNPAYDKDQFESTAWTLNGKIGPLRAVYTGGYLVRNVEQTGDYTNYARGVYADYYQCYGPSIYHTNLKSTCFSPSAYWNSDERNAHQQHEFRLSTPDEWRFRGIVGAFWESNTLYDQTGWNYKTVPSCTSNGADDTPGNTGCFANVGTIPGSSVANPGIQGDSTSFYQDTQRKTKQTAFFASLDYDLIPKVLTLTAGTRHFRFDNYSAGSVVASFGCFEGGTPATGCHVTQNSVPAGSPYYYSYNLNAANLKDTESGFKSRVNLTWHVTPDTMVYYTFSQGFRPGGFNQNGNSPHAFTPAIVPQYFIPSSYSSDKLTNNEIGWKTEFFNDTLQWNGAVYREDWDNVQVAFFDPGAVGNIFFNTNGQDFLIKGVETSLVWRVITGLTVQGGASWNHSEQTNAPVLVDNNPASANFGKPITNACNSFGANCQNIVNPFGPIGSPSANAPPLQFSVRARYEWTMPGSYLPFVQVGATHNAHSFTQAGANPTIGAGAISTGRLRFENPAYSTYDASIGVAKDNWTFDIYGQNLSNSNASTFVSTDQFIVAQTPLRPRVLGAEFNFKF